MTDPERVVLYPHARRALGGSSVSSALLARAVAESGAWSPRVVVAGAGAPADLHRRFGLPVDDLGIDVALRRDPTLSRRFSRAQLLARLAPMARAYLSGVRPALVHVNDGDSLLVWGPAARRLDIPVVWHVRQPRGNRITDWRRVRLADFLVFVADGNRPRVAHVRNLPPSRTVYNGLDLADFDPSPEIREAQRLELGASGATRVIGFVGNLVDQKRPQWVARAARDLAGRGHDVLAVFVGQDYSGGRIADELRALGTSGPLRDRVVLTGRRDDVTALMQAMDVLVLPARREAFGRVLIEAMALGVPVVGTAAGGVPEIIEHGRNGLLCDPGDLGAFTAAVARVLDDPDLAAALAAEGRTTVARRFTADRAAREILDVYEQVVADHARRGRVGVRHGEPSGPTRSARRSV
jgi:glycosyltransferase involved in cell wall biosynthesis